MLTLFTSSLTVISVLLILIGFFNLCFLNGANTRIQLHTENRYRSRVMSMYTMVNTGSTPIGNSFTGLVMSLLSARFGFFIDGLVTVLLILLVFNIYYRKNKAEKKIHVNI